LAENHQSVLSFIEANEFKQSPYFVLRLGQVSDGTLKRHLAGVIQSFRVFSMWGVLTGGRMSWAR
jgi:hypothetical protein